MNENESYIFGLLMTDGCLELRDRNRGKISLEISYKLKYQKLYYRVNDFIGTRKNHYIRFFPDTLRGYLPHPSFPLRCAR